MNTTPSIILVHPQLAENVGMAARAMMNCNLYDLRLVAPRENHLSAKAVSASSGAEEILQQAKIYASVPEAIADLQQVLQLLPATVIRPKPSIPQKKQRPK